MLNLHKMNQNTVPQAISRLRTIREKLGVFPIKINCWQFFIIFDQELSKLSMKEVNLIVSFSCRYIMLKLTLNYVTWDRPDANGLYDYHRVDESQKAFTIVESGYVYRHKQDYSLKYVPRTEKDCFEKNCKEEFLLILKIIRKQSHYLVNQVEHESQKLCKIITNKFPEAGSYVLNQADNLRFGKVQIGVLSLEFKNKKASKSHYQKNLKNIQMCANIKNRKISRITPSFYQQCSVSSQSLVETNPQCRYCHSKTITKENPFIVSCLCKGYTKYVHEDCLMQWILQREKLEKTKKGIYFIKSKYLECELCHQYFELKGLFRTLLKHQRKKQGSNSIIDFADEEQFQVQMSSRNRAETQGLKQFLPVIDLATTYEHIPNEQLLILEFKCQSSFIFFIDLGQNRTISIGRSIDCDIVLNELSVSRNHAQLQINADDKTVTLVDCNSKFGTLVRVRKAQIENNQVYQLGRSKIRFSKFRHKTLLEKIGFCFVEEKLNKEKKPIKSQAVE